MQKETTIKFMSSHSYINWDDTIHFTEANTTNGDKVFFHITFAEPSGMKDLHEALGRMLERKNKELKEQIRKELETQENE